MRRRKRALLAVAIAALSAACSTSSVATGKITGSVHSANSAMPVDFTGATVSIGTQVVALAGSGSVSFSFGDLLVPGTYAVVATVPRSAEGTLQMAVSLGDAAASVSMAFTPGPSLGTLAGSVRGLATYSDVLVSIPGRGVQPNVQDGSYSLEGLSYGEYIITATAPSSVEKSRTLKVVVTAASTRAPDINFTPAPGNALSGIALVYPALPKAGVQVALGGLPSVPSVVTDASGIFSFPSPGSGRGLTLTVSSGGYSETIPGVSYQPNVGSTVEQDGALYSLAQAPFELQAGAHILYPGPGGARPFLAATSSDASMIAYMMWNSSGALSLLVKRIAGGAAPILVSSSLGNYGNFAAFSPDGKWIAFSTAEELGTESLFVAPVPATGTSTTPVRVLKNLRGSWYRSWDFSPSGSVAPSIYAITAGPPQDGSPYGSGLFEVGVQSGAILNAIPTLASGSSFRLLGKLAAPRILFFTGAAAPYSLVSARCTGAPIVVGDQVTIDSTLTSTSLPVLSDDESLLAYTNAGLRGGSTSAPSTMLDTGAPYAFDIRISPFGSQLAYQQWYVLSGVYFRTLFTRDFQAGTASVSLGKNPSASGAGRVAEFTPDGRVFYAVEDPSVATSPPQVLFLGPVTGVSPARVVSFPSGSSASYSTSPSGSKVVYTLPPTSASAGLDVFSAGTTGGSLKLATIPDLYSPAFWFTGDSSKVVFAFGAVNGLGTVSYVPLDGSKALTTVSMGVSSFSLQPGASTSHILLLVSDGVSSSGTRVWSFATGTTTPLVGRADSSSSWLHATTGAEPDRVLSLRSGSPAPYKFQDGCYVSSVP